MDGKKMVAAEEKHLIPLDKVNGYEVRPGFYGINGATALREGVNFTVSSLEAAGVELLLYHRGEKEPYAVLPFPKHYRMIRPNRFWILMRGRLRVRASGGNGPIRIMNTGPEWWSMILTGETMWILSGRFRI